MKKESRIPLIRGLRFIFIIFFLFLAFVPWDRYFDAGVDLKTIGVGPSLQHLLGTDNLGRDLLVRLSSVLRDVIVPIWLTVLISSLAGIGIAIIVLLLSEENTAFKRVIDFLGHGFSFIASVPIGILVFLLAVYYEETGLRMVLVGLSVLLAIRSYLQVFDLYAEDKRLGYWLAHEAQGGTLFSRLIRYGLGMRWKESILLALVFHLQIAVTIESALSYLGFGIQEPQASFGNMLASHFDMYLKGDWGILLIILIVMGLTFQFPKNVAIIGKYLRRKFIFVK
ncbi:MAG: hypothetical protein R3B45_00645 [Bdellovibrionota bacterium]